MPDKKRYKITTEPKQESTYTFGVFDSTPNNETIIAYCASKSDAKLIAEALNKLLKGFKQ